MTITNFADEQCPFTWEGRGNRAELRVVIRPDYRITVVVGRIKKKNDGRWEWSYLPCRHGFFTAAAPPDKQQGAVSTEAEAKERLQSIWGAKLAP